MITVIQIKHAKGLLEGEGTPVFLTNCLQVVHQLVLSQTVSSVEEQLAHCRRVSNTDCAQYADGNHTSCIGCSCMTDSIWGTEGPSLHQLGAMSFGWDVCVKAMHSVYWIPLHVKDPEVLFDEERGCSPYFWLASRCSTLMPKSCKVHGALLWMAY